MKHAPEHIFIEFTRDDQNSSVSKTRYKQLNKKYKIIAAMVDNLAPTLKSQLYPTDDLQKLMKEKKDILSNDRLMLYFSQMGKSLYSDKNIEINEIFTPKYQIDHILPQSYIPDDSLENKALVLSHENQMKTDSLLLEDDIIKKNITRWEYLKKAGLIGPKKFANLTRTQVTDKQKRGFINRQIVQTSQMIKNVANILNSIYPDTQIIETRARLGAMFRNAFSNYNKDNYNYQYPEFVKNRNINDFHHAQDAYISSIVGSYKLKKYPEHEMEFVYDAYSKYLDTLNKKRKNGKIPEYSNNGIIIGSMFNGNIQRDKLTGEIIWDQKIKNRIIKTFGYKQYNLTRMAKTYDGTLYKTTIQKHNPKAKLAPIKKGMDTAIYGGYTGENTSYATLVNIDGKNKLVNIPVRIANEIKNGEINQSKWIEQNTKFKKSIKIILNSIPLGQLVKSNKYGLIYLSSGKEMINAQQLFLPYKEVALLSLLEKVDPSDYHFVLEKYNKNILNNIYADILRHLNEFYKLFSSEYKNLKNNQEEFNKLNPIDKVKIIKELLSMTHANSSNANIKFGDISSSRFGRRSNGYEFSNSDFIYQSPTGLYESRIHID